MHMFNSIAKKNFQLLLTYEGVGVNTEKGMNVALVGASRIETGVYKAERKEDESTQRQSTETHRMLGPEKAWRCPLGHSPALRADADYPKGL